LSHPPRARPPRNPPSRPNVTAALDEKISETVIQKIFDE
jgi:hypothetical protein